MRVRVPAKVNLCLSVGPVRPDGYHDLRTVFHAVGLYDDLTLVESAPGSGTTITVTGEGADAVPLDDDNIAVRAVAMAARKCGRPADLSIDIVKAIPVAGGMAGGSADAAAALVGCQALWGAPLDDSAVHALAARLGSDVPFLLHGGTMLGTGRGEVLAPVLVRGEFHWVVATSDSGLSTPAVYAELDRLRSGSTAPASSSPDDLLVALRAGDPVALGRSLSNDLEAAAIALRPPLARLLEAGIDLGALGGIVSGSGPTCIFLARDREHALDIAVGLTTTGLVRSVRHAVGPVGGAQVIR